MRLWHRVSILPSAFRFPTNSSPPMRMSKSLRRRRRAISPSNRRTPTTAPSWSAVHSTNTDTLRWINFVTPETAAAYSLLTAEAVRARAHHLLAIGLQDKLPHFLIDTDRLTSVADLVLAVTREAYPTLDVPFHSRWRQFVFAGKDRWRAVADSSPWRDVAARARAEFDLVITSVFLDAGAGPRWRFNDAATGTGIGRSEGLALASLAMFVDGAFSGRLQERLRADADRLRHITAADVARGFHVTTANPLVRLESRADLLRPLGEVGGAATEVFARADAPRPRGLFGHLGALAINRNMPRPHILS